MLWRRPSGLRGKARAVPVETVPTFSHGTPTLLIDGGVVLVDCNIELQVIWRMLTHAQQYPRSQTQQR